MANVTEPLLPDAVVPDEIETLPLIESFLITSGVEISAAPEKPYPESPDCATTLPPMALDELGAEDKLIFPAIPFSPADRPL